MSKQDADLMREAVDQLNDMGDGGPVIRTDVIKKLLARADELDPPPELEPWERIGTVLSTYAMWPADWRKDTVWVARAKHVTRIATEGTVPVDALEKLCEKWVVDRGFDHDTGISCAVHDLREVLAGREL